METKKFQTAKVFHDYDGVTHTVEYEDVDGLINCIFILLMEEYNGIEDAHDDNVRVDLPDGRSFYWNETVANYYIKSRITAEQAFEEMMNQSEKEAAV